MRQRLLALDTSARDAIVGIRIGDRQPIVHPVPRETGRHARNLIPTLRDLLSSCQVSPHELTGVAVNLGPGSFTGLRVGVAAAQTLAWAAKIPAVGIGLFDLLAAASDAGRERRLIANAERNELFVAVAQVGESTPSPTRIVPDDVFIAELPDDVDVIGTVPRRLHETLGPRVIAPRESLLETLLRLAAAKLAVGETTLPSQLLPIYGRRSAAEELRDAGRRPNYESPNSR